jgi:gliding motility-associated-like protein
VYAGNTFNTVSWNVDSLSFTPVGYKIYSGLSPSSLSLIDSISVGSTLVYNHYGLTNGQKYYYAVKAISRTGTVSSIFSNMHSGTPGIYKAKWSISPQLSGLNTAIMAASVPSASSSLRYFFENTASGITQNSGWIKSPAYKDSTLSSGVSTSFRVKLADSTNINATQSDWSDLISVTAAVDSVQGGYTYNWASFNNSDNNVYGLGPLHVTQDFTGTPFIKHIPPFGIHPRVFCNPEDSTTIRLQLKNTNSGRAIAKKIHAFTTLLTLGTKGSPGVFNNTPSSSYAVDSLGVYYIGTGNAFNFFNQKPTYDSLATYKNANGIGRDDNLSVLLADEAFECWLFKGTIDPTTGTSYNARAKKLTNAFSHWAALVINDHATNPASTRNLGGNVGLIYDFAFNFMSTAQQDTVRRAMSMLAAHTWTYNGGSDYYGLNITSYANTSNWTTWGNQTLNDLAMEGEPGANTTRTITYARANWNFLTYGIYETGQPYEGMGKNELDARLLVALARRGYSMLGHPNLRAFATKYLPAITQPFGNSFVGTDLLGGFDNYYGALTSNYAAYGGWRFKGVDMVALKYIYPNDVAVDYVWKNYIKQYTADQNAKDGYYQYQSLGGQTPFFADLLAAIYPANYSSASNTNLAQAAFSGNASYFDYRGGMAVFRSGFDQNAATLWFHNRDDMGGHAYSNKNDVMYSALGRAWMPKISTNANSNNVWCDVTNANSGILINGKGACADTGGNFMKVPGKIVYYNSTDAISSVGGDATLAYSYLWLSGGSGYAPITETRNSFQYVQSSLPYFNISFSNYPNWMNAGQNNNWVKKPYNICKKVFRTVALIKDANPYALIVDDVQKDATNNNNYKWIGQMAADLVVDSVVVNLNNSSYRNDIIFKEPSNTGNRRFLVRVLNNTGQKDPNAPGVVNNYWIPGQPTRSAPRLILESISKDPQFKVMLYAYVAGSKLPVTTWTSAAHDSLIVTNSGATQMVYFPVDTSGRTNIFLANAPLQGNYVIVNKNSKKPLNVIGSALKDSVFIEQNQADTVSQKWTVKSVGQGYYTIVNKNSGKFMDVYQNSKNAGGRIVQNARNNLDDQLWRITERGGGFYSISNKNSGLSLYIDSSSVKNGAIIRQGAYTGADNQLFNFNQQIDLIGGINLPPIQPDTIAPLQLQSQVINFGVMPTKTYGDADFNPGASSNNAGIPITYSSSDTTVAVITSAGKIHIKGAGQATITASQQGNSGYNAAVSVTQLLTVIPAKLTVTANNQIKIYGSVNPTLTFSNTGFVNGETIANLKLKPVANTTAVTNSPVGVYPITVSGAVSLNYSFTYVQGSLKIDSLARTLTFNTLPAKTYGDSDFDPAAFTNTVDTIIYTSSNPTIATIINGKIHIVSAGSVAITASVASKSGYTNVSPRSHVLNISKANQIINFNPIPIQTFGGPNLILSITSSSGLTVVLSSSDTKIATVSSQTIYLAGVGTAIITATQAGDTNYFPATASQVITIQAPANTIMPKPIVPNGFTPNGDGVNDTWEILNFDKYPACTVKVFNRAGQNVYSSIGYLIPWDGRFKGEVLPAGTYFYVIDLKSNGEILSGSVNLIK